MTEYMHLVGTEDVQRAGNVIAGAADNMYRAASNMDEALTRHGRFLDDWLIRLEEVLIKSIGKGG